MIYTFYTFRSLVSVLIISRLCLPLQPTASCCKRYLSSLQIPSNWGAGWCSFVHQRTPSVQHSACLSEVCTGFLSKAPLSPDVTQLALHAEKSLDPSVFPWRKERRRRVYLGWSSQQVAALSGVRVEMASYRFQTEAQKGCDQAVHRALGSPRALTRVIGVARNQRKEIMPSERIVLLAVQNDCEIPHRQMEMMLNFPFIFREFGKQCSCLHKLLVFK